jgi:hypothetical protein
MVLMSHWRCDKHCLNRVQQKLAHDGCLTRIIAWFAAVDGVQALVQARTTVVRIVGKDRGECLTRLRV